MPIKKTSPNPRPQKTGRGGARPGSGRKPGSGPDPWKTIACKTSTATHIQALAAQKSISPDTLLRQKFKIDQPTK